MITGAELARVREKLAFAESLLGSNGLFVVDDELRVIHWSAQMARILGVSAEEVLGRAIGEVFPTADETERNALRAALSGDTLISSERPFAQMESRRGGWFEATYSPLRADAGAVVGAIAVVRDVTARKLAEEHLRETETRFRNMADASPVLLWMAGTDALCTFFNQSWLDFTGRTLEQEWGVGWAEGVHFEDFQRCMDTYMAAFNDRQSFEMEYRLRRKDGDFRWVLDRGTPRYTPEGIFAGFIGSCIDITDRKSMEARLERAVKERDDFLSIAAHELRTPLTALQLQVEMLERAMARVPDDPGARLTVRVKGANAQVGRLNALVEELLDVSRLASGNLELFPEASDLVALVTDVAGRLAPAVSAAGCELNIDAPETLLGEWDPSRLERVLVNLVTNAFKYGAGKPIDVIVSGDDTSASIAIRDRGIGIAPEDHHRIFERFERAVSASNYGGFGLGLWISRRIVEAHGGTIRVESAVGAGSTFTVTLPRRMAR